MEAGSWTYDIVADKGVALRDWPSNLATTGPGPKKGEQVHICARLVVGGQTFLRLSDGKGWVFDKNKDGKSVAVHAC